MVKENLAACLEKIEAAAKKSGAVFSQIILVAVIKGVPLPFIQEAIDNGIQYLGENRIQEALLKYEPLNSYARAIGRPLHWHMVGHLQSNKAKEAVRIFDLIHSVDSVSLASEIDKQAGRINKIQDILIQVNVSAEATKYGFNVGSTPAALKEMSGFKNINIRGLMTIAPLLDHSEKARPYFRQLRQLSDRINELRILNSQTRVLSMGMSDDFPVALEEGATMVRIGRGIFGERQAV